MVPEVEFSHCLRNSDDRKQSSRCDVHVADLGFAFPLEFSLLNVSCHDVLVQIVWDDGFVGLRFGNE